jgi:hypothetical protein
MSVQMVEVPKLRIYGAGVINRLTPYVLGGKIADDIKDYGKEFHELHNGSITLGEQAGLWNAYLLSELGELDLGEAEGAIHSLFENDGRGNVTDDACNYDGGIKLKKLKDSDISVEWIIHPEGFEKKNGIWRAVGGDRRYILIPGSGYVALTCDGSYRSDTGTPFMTVPTRSEAEKSWIDRGYSQEFARKAVSYFYRRNEGKETASVSRWSSGSDCGRFVVSAADDPGGMGGLGSLGVSRTVKRSEAGQALDIIVLHEKEYRKLKKTGQLEAMKESLFSLS